MPLKLSGPKCLWVPNATDQSSNYSSEENISILEQFTILVYDCSNSLDNINQAHFEIMKKGTEKEKILPQMMHWCSTSKSRNTNVIFIALFTTIVMESLTTTQLKPPKSKQQQQRRNKEKMDGNYFSCTE